MTDKPETRPIGLTYGPGKYIPNYNIISELVNLPKIDGMCDHADLVFLYNPKFAILRESVPLPEKRIFNIPHKRMYNWNNYVVRSMRPDYLESWRNDCKIPDNWVGPRTSCELVP